MVARGIITTVVAAGGRRAHSLPASRLWSATFGEAWTIAAAALIVGAAFALAAIRRGKGPHGGVGHRRIAPHSAQPTTRRLRPWNIR
jgi:hypothetical protein